jgi:dolichyl-phosphate-mannose--protein O-mannosyl transferase
MGCALATKWYYVPGWLLILGLALREQRNYRSLRTAALPTSLYLLVPATVYILSYVPWFGRGYALSELGELVVNAYYALQSFRPQGYSAGLVYLSHISAAEWFASPVIVGTGSLTGSDHVQVVLYMNNLPIWIWTLPATMVMAAVATRRKSLALALPALVFGVTYLLFLFIKRPAFIYSAAPLLPFAFVATAWATTELAERTWAKLYYVVLIILLAWSLYLYPLATAKTVPLAPYRLILDHGDVRLNR